MEKWSDAKTLVVAFALILLIAAPLLWLAGLGGELPNFDTEPSAPATVSPAFASCSSFAFYSTKGTIVYTRAGGSERRIKEDSAFQGMPTFVVTGAAKGLVRGNLGSAPVEVYRTESSITFTEVTATGNQQVFTVTNQWEANGFRASYTREGTFGEERRQAAYSGIAKPLEY